MNLFSKESLASGLKTGKETLTSGLKSGKETLTSGLKTGKESLTSFTSGFKSLANPLKALANNAKKILTTKDEPQNQISDLIFIYPRIFWMTFPTKEKITELSTTLNTQFPKGNYYIWNVGEQKYDTTRFNNQVAEYNFVGYPCPPFQFILLICKSILEWLNSDKDNVAIIHCQSNAGRSSIIISCLLSLLKVVNHPMEALTYFCNKLQLNDTSFLLPSQKQAIKNFANLMDNIQLNDKVMTIQKIVLSEAPEIIEETKDNKTDEKQDKEKNVIRPYLQIFRGSKAIYNHLSQEKLPKAYTIEDKNIEFEMNIDVTDDILIRCRNYKSDEERQSMFRLVFVPCLNFGETVRLYKRDIDFSTFIKVSDNFYLEFSVKPSERIIIHIYPSFANFLQETNQDIAVITKLKADCIQLAEEYKKKKDKSSQKIVAVEKEEDLKNKFDIVDTSKEGSEDREHDGSEDGSRDSRDILTPSTDAKLQKFFTSIQQEDEGENKENEEEEDEDLDDYISKLENKGA